MTRVIDWLKSNLIIVVSAVVALVGIGLVGYVYFVADAALIDDIAKQDEPFNQIDRYMQARFEVPTPDPAQPTRTVTQVITPAVIDDLKTVYGELSGKYDNIVNRVVEINRRGHYQLLDRDLGDQDNLFPQVRDFQRFQARNQYRSDIRSLLLNPATATLPDQPAPREHLPYLNAGQPPTPDALDRQIQAVEREFGAIGGISDDRMRNMSLREQQQLEQAKQNRLLEVLGEAARDIHLYAQTDILASNYPLTIANWAVTDGRPTDAQLWEAQMELWIQQDIVRAMMIANRVASPEDPRQPNPLTDVTRAPIKRLSLLQVQPGYVGLQHFGLVSGGENQRGGASFGGRGGGGGGSAGSDQADSYAYPPTMHNDPKAKPSDDFFAGPTGRVSNALYDVRHVRVVADMDWRQLPQFIDALAQVNFMTVIDMDIRALDEYEMLAQHYVYGTSDVVQVEMVIETLWMRAWREELMPEKVKQFVGLASPPEGTAGGPGFNPGYGPGGPPGAY